jgi:Ca2+-binding EF-hand superfamily protein
MLYSSAAGGLAAAGFCISSLSSNNTIMAEYGHLHSVEEHFHLLQTLRELAPKIDATKMLTEFLDELKMSSKETDHLFSSEFVRGLFIDSGVVDEELTKHLIDIMDWNNNGKLTKYEVAALITLFNVGTDVERYKFLFNCLDLDQSGSVYKDEFREILTCLLEAKYHIYGLENERDPDEIYRDIGVEEYHTMAKFNANQLARKIFIWADQKKRGKLNWNEFLHWCYRGGNDVLALKELLHQTHDVSEASAIYHKYKPGYIPEYSQQLLP